MAKHSDALVAPNRRHASRNWKAANALMPRQKTIWRCKKNELNNASKSVQWKTQNAANSTFCNAKFVSTGLEILPGK